MMKWIAGVAVSALAAFPVAAQAPKPATGMLTIAFAAEATMMDPQRSAAGVDQYYIGQMFEQLVKTDPSLKRINWLAESWEVKEEDGKPYLDIKLRRGVKFHNGDLLTSADFE